jgi:glycosyltransferase involved in cell wall biosynthesis
MSAQPLRLAIVTPHHASVAGGGAEYQIECLIGALAPTQCYDISYLARSVDTTFQPQGYRIERIGKSNDAPRLGYLMDAPALFRALKKVRPDVIYQRVACGYTGIAAQYAKQYGARLIWHVAHDQDVSEGGSTGGRNPLRPILEKLSVEFGIRHAHHIVVQTEKQVRLLKQNYGRVADAVIPNFQPEPRETLDKSGPISVLWVANFKQWKRPELFVQAAMALRDLPDARFVMAGAPATGRGDREWNAALMQSIVATPNVVYVGEKRQSEINQLFAKSHLFVNTSRYEGFPNTFIQAWMREVPVVSLDVDPDDILERESIGVHARSMDRLIASIRAYITDPSKRAEHGARARRYAMLRHSLGNVRLLEQLIQSGRTTSVSPTVPV